LERVGAAVPEVWLAKSLGSFQYKSGYGSGFGSQISPCVVDGGSSLA
jgi:hypothetical protein